MVPWAFSVDGGLTPDALTDAHRLPPLNGRIFDARGKVLALSHRVDTAPNGGCPTTVQIRRGFRDDSRCCQVSVPVQPGNSGGLLVDMRGNVLGMVLAFE